MGNGQFYPVIPCNMLQKADQSVLKETGCTETIAVADPGFLRQGAGANPRVWAEILLFQKIIFQKLHKNERNWKRRGRTSLAPHLDPP